jgi:wyosine [tRNA(Phe)-imidazoG37] synthetase (radical SAM superfamily)
MAVMEGANINSISKTTTKTIIRTNIKVRMLVILERLLLMLQLNKRATIIKITIIKGVINVDTEENLMEDIEEETKEAIKEVKVEGNQI